MKDRNVHFLFQPRFDFETAGRGNIFEVDAAKAWFERGNDLDQLVGILCVQTERYSVDIGQRFEQHAFSFHDRHSGFRPDISQTENGGAVGNNSNCVSFSGIGIHLFRIGLDFQAWRGNAWRIGNGQIILVFDGHFVFGLELAFPFLVFLQSFCCIIHFNSPPRYLIRFRPSYPSAGCRQTQNGHGGCTSRFPDSDR